MILRSGRRSSTESHSIEARSLVFPLPRFLIALISRWSWLPIINTVASNRRRKAMPASTSSFNDSVRSLSLTLARSVRMSNTSPPCIRRSGLKPATKLKNTFSASRSIISPCVSNAATHLIVLAIKQALSLGWYIRPPSARYRRIPLCQPKSLFCFCVSALPPSPESCTKLLGVVLLQRQELPPTMPTCVRNLHGDVHSHPV